MSSDGGDGFPLQRIRRFIWPNEIPDALIYGDSHMCRLADWLNQPKLERIDNLPTPLDRRVLSKAKFCAVGGSTFATVHDRVRGIKVPAHQPKRGNQWEKVIKHKFHYTVVSLGGNDISNIRSKLADRRTRVLGDNINDETDDNKFIDNEFATLKSKVDEVFDRLKNTFQGSRRLYIATLNRIGWEDEICAIASRLNSYIETYWANKVVYLHAFIDETDYKRDDVHLKNSGYRKLVEHVFASIMNSFLQKVMIHQKELNRCIDLKRQYYANLRKRRLGLAEHSLSHRKWSARASKLLPNNSYVPNYHCSDQSATAVNPVSHDGSHERYTSNSAITSRCITEWTYYDSANEHAIQQPDMHTHNNTYLPTQHSNLSPLLHTTHSNTDTYSSNAGTTCYRPYDMSELNAWYASQSTYPPGTGQSGMYSSTQLASWLPGNISMHDGHTFHNPTYSETTATCQDTCCQTGANPGNNTMYYERPLTNSTYSETTTACQDTCCLPGPNPMYSNHNQSLGYTVDNRYEHTSSGFNHEDVLTNTQSFSGHLYYDTFHNQTQTPYMYYSQDTNICYDPNSYEANQQHFSYPAHDYSTSTAMTVSCTPNTSNCDTFVTNSAYQDSHTHDAGPHSYDYTAYNYSYSYD